jgi:N-acetylmuramoyl-L-alanine amidase
MSTTPHHHRSRDRSGRGGRPSAAWLNLLAGLVLLACSPVATAPNPPVPEAQAPASSRAPDRPATAVEVPQARPTDAQPAGDGTTQLVGRSAGAPAAPGSEAVGEEELPDAVSPTDRASPPGVSADAGCELPEAPAPLSLPDGPDRWRAFREPLPQAPLWNPPGRKRVGLQAGHWLVEESPPELGRLQPGAVGGGKQEWEVNLDLAQRAKLLLEEAGVEVDLLPSTIPVRYRANAFVAIHADGDPAGAARGFKVARPGFSSIPDVDDQLVAALNAAYGTATALPRDDEHISLRMRFYYAFNSRRYCHAVAPGVPQAIVEAGYLTSAADRALLFGDPVSAARGIANGVLAFLAALPPPPSSSGPARG